jgi:hypothetical protein
MFPKIYAESVRFFFLENEAIKQAIKNGYLTDKELNNLIRQAISKQLINERSSLPTQVTTDVVAKYVIDKLTINQEKKVEDYLEMFKILIGHDIATWQEKYFLLRAAVRHRILGYDDVLRAREYTKAWLYQEIKDNANIAAEEILANLGITGEAPSQPIALPIQEAYIKSLDYPYLTVVLPDGTELNIDKKDIVRFQRLRIYPYMRLKGDLGLRMLWLTSSAVLEKYPISNFVIENTQNDETLMAAIEAYAYCVAGNELVNMVAM